MEKCLRDQVKKYRPCIVAVFKKEDGQVLACQRSDNGAWQFPQGGLEKGETSEEALYREVREEIGTDSFRILKKTEDTFFYDFPTKLGRSLFKHYSGQEQRWFLCSFNEGHFVEKSKIITPEFVDFKWTSVSCVVGQMVSWKREAYLGGLEALGLGGDF